MSQCNIFRPIKKNKSNFFLFSQFGDDLTKEYTQKDHYRIVPSQYICMDLNIAKFADANKDKGDVNNSFVELLQNYYENFMCFYRYMLTKTDDGYKFGNIPARAPRDIAQGVLLNMLIDNNLVTYNKTDATIPEIKFIGDINVYASDSNEDGVNFNEIFCVIPPEAKEHKYNIVPSSVWVNGNASKVVYKDINGTVPDYIWGWTDDNAFDYGISYKPWTTEWPNTTYELTKVESVPVESNEFDFNAVLVCYDIIDPHYDSAGSNYIVASNVPMGLYITGSCETKDDKLTIVNKVTHYTNSENLYNNGTSYSLRIATRYLTTQNATEFQSTTVDVEDFYPEYSSVMQSMSDAITEFKNTVDTNNKIYDAMTKHLGMFKNSTVNVPYTLKMADGNYYWFVNGKNTGRIAQYTADVSKILITYDNEASLYIRTPVMSDQIANGINSENPEDMYIVNYYSGDDRVYIRNLKIKNSLQLFKDGRYIDIEDYVNYVMNRNAKHLVYDLDGVAYPSTDAGSQFKAYIQKQYEDKVAGNSGKPWDEMIETYEDGKVDLDTMLSALVNTTGVSVTSSVDNGAATSAVTSIDVTRSDDGNLNVTYTKSPIQVVTSDDRLNDYKDDVDIPIEQLVKIPVKYYSLKNDNDNIYVGTSAQEVQKICPELVNTNPDGYLSVDYSKLSLLCLSAIKDLNRRVEELESKK